MSTTITPQAPTTPRPSVQDEAIRRAAAEKLWPQILADHLDDVDDDERDQATLVRLLTDSLYEHDGYAIAKHLDDGGDWPGRVDTALVETLSLAYGIMLDERKKHIAAWLPTAGITPPPLQAHLYWTRRREWGPGLVTELDTTLGVALTAFPGREGRTHVPWEELTA